MVSLRKIHFCAIIHISSVVFFTVPNSKTVFNTLKMKINLSFIYILSSYRAENTLSLGYENQSVNIVHKKNQNTVSEEYKIK